MTVGDTVLWRSNPAMIAADRDGNDLVLIQMLGNDDYRKVPAEELTISAAKLTRSYRRKAGGSLRWRK